MSSLTLPQYFYELLDRILRANDFNEYSIEIKPGAGEGCGTELFGIHVTERTFKKTLSVVCKMAKLDEIQRKNFPPSTNFERETYFYDKIVPMFLNFQQVKNLPRIDQFHSHPKCYGTIKDHDKEQYAIVLEDLRQRGFRMWDKFNSVPIENMRSLIREIGKLHGISFALKDQRPHEFAPLENLTDTLRIFTEKQILRNILNVSFDRAIKSLAKEDHKNIIRDIKENFSEYLEYCVDNNTTKRFAVLSHGDLWNNNLMYRFNVEEIADDVCILDWQSVRYVSPALDLHYTIFSSTDKALRDEHYMNLLRLYHETLSKTIEMLGGDPDKLFTFENLQNEMKRCGNYALLWAPAVIAESTRAMTDSESAQKESQLRFDKRLDGLLEDITSLGYYRKFSKDELDQYRRS